MQNCFFCWKFHRSSGKPLFRNMIDLKDKSIHRTAEKLTEDIKIMKVYETFYNDLQRLVCSSNVRKDDFKLSLLDSMKQSGMETELRNTVFHWIRSHNNCSFDSLGSAVREPLTYLRKAQLQWEKRIHKSLNSMCNELSVPLARMRTTSDREELEERWSELSTYDVDLTQYRPVYAPKDFLEVLLLIRSPNYRTMDDSMWDFTQIPLHVRNITDLRGIYQELSRGEAILGVNPNMSSSSSCHTLESERTVLGEKVLASNQAPVAQEFLKRGSPRCLRGRLWAQVLGSTCKHPQYKYFAELKHLVLLHDLMVDKLIIKDVQLTASNDDQYFVFEDVLYQVMMCFSRDTEILSVFNHSSASPISALLKGKSSSIDNTVAYPPNGIIPFHGFTMYAAPFCYVYDDPVPLYNTFRAFYLRYWFRLHEVSSHPQGLLSLCVLFERLLERHEPQLWLHFKQVNVQPAKTTCKKEKLLKQGESLFDATLLGLYRIRIVFKWLMRSFSGHLPPEQLLMLWDLVLAYDSLEIQPLLAVAILSFRRENLLQVNTQQSIEAVLADLSSISVMPLLQLALMRD